MRRERRRSAARRVPPQALASALACVALLALNAATAAAKPSTRPFEIAPSSFKVQASTLQAGAHEDLTVAFDIGHNGSGETFNDLRDTLLELPPGFVGSDTAVPTCTEAQLLANGGAHTERSSGSACPIASQIGTISFELMVNRHPVKFVEPLYSMEVANAGIAAEFGFRAGVFLTQVLIVTVRPGDSGLTTASLNLNPGYETHNVSVTVWGVPAAHEHDAQRGRICEGEECFGGEEQANTTPRPFLSTPTACGSEPLVATLRADSWEAPEAWVQARSEIGQLSGCERVPFHPFVQATPTTDAAESPTGLDVALDVPQQWETPEVLSTSTLKGTKVTLPVGYTVNPSAGNGLVGCTPAEYEAETAASPPGAGCPAQSKLGKVTIETPLIAEIIKGDVYIAKPYDNPFDSLLAMYIVAKDPQRGIIVKAAGRVEPNPLTGQLVTTFDNTPQQPFNKLALELKQGQTSPLVSPPTCGTYTVDAELTPWSSLTLPGEAPVGPSLLSNSFQIEHGIGGGPCPSGGVPPFNPTVISGTLDNAAGSFSPFYLRIERKDGEQEITKFSTTMPPGLSGSLTGIPFCPEADIEAARHRTGAEELERPSCPQGSEVGHSITEAGVGAVLAQTPGRIYLAGPYHGAPLSLVSVTSAKVGPFDLGTVVIRFALDINPLTAQVEVSGAKSEPIPHIIDGIVVHVRDIRVYIDRQHFIINPTSCEPMAVQEAIAGAGANPADPTAQDTVPASARFQAADCANLQFKPVLQASTTGRTSRRNGASLHVRLTYPSLPQGAEANIHYVKVELPKQLPSRLETLRKACLIGTFDANPAACPSASRVGTAKAITPILPVPLEGPAYFVSYGGAKFPELIVVLQGYGLTIDLHGETFIDERTGITSSTFHDVPDEPVSSFELTLPQGPYSALAANTNLCEIARTVLVEKRVKIGRKGHVRFVKREVRRRVAGNLTMPTTLVGQNGAEIHQSTVIGVSGCGEPRKAKKPNRRRRR